MQTASTTCALGVVPFCPTRTTVGSPAPAARAVAVPVVRCRRHRVSHVTAAQTSPKSEAEETTEKYGLEAGLWKVLTSSDQPSPSGSSSTEEGEAAAAPLSKTEQAKQLLARYGSAYLITSISFAIVSFAACYALVTAGVDVAGLLARVGLQVNDTSEKVGTFAIAYAAHKALSPVRFPPTVALTPVVARWLGKDKEQQQADGQ